MMDRDFVASVVREILIDVLAVEAEEAVGSARFFLELDGESIDLLETQFQIEKKLKISVNFQKVLGGESLPTDNAGHLTADALATIRAALPFLDFTRLPERVTLDSLIRELLTVDAIRDITWNAVQSQSNAMPLPA